MFFDKFDNKTVIKGTLVAIDPIHIGSSADSQLDPTAVDSSVLKDSTGRAVIPGSSLKGVMRSYFEAVVRGIYGSDAVCDILDKKGYCTYRITKSLKDNANISLKEKSEKIYENSCIVCRLFGGRDMAGKLQFKDSFLIDEPIYEFRDGVGIDRETGAASKGVKYDFEIVPKGARFDFCLIAENLDSEQEKQLEFLIDQLKSGEIAVGGKTTRGLGRIKLCDEKIERTDADAIKARLGL